MTGELTAAIAVLKNWTYPVTAESIEETDITGWDKPTMVQLMRRYPDIAINLLGIILARIDDVQHRYLEVCTEHVINASPAPFFGSCGEPVRKHLKGYTSTSL